MLLASKQLLSEEQAQVCQRRYLENLRTYVCVCVCMYICVYNPVLLDLMVSKYLELVFATLLRAR